MAYVYHSVTCWSLYIYHHSVTYFVGAMTGSKLFVYEVTALLVDLASSEHSFPVVYHLYDTVLVRLGAKQRVRANCGTFGATV